MADSRRSSILKPPKQRNPLQEVNSLNIHHHDDFTSTTVTQNIMRRVSFAGTSTVKEFDTQAESVLVCHTPAYEESFAASDSSVPSDLSSRIMSRSTISIEDQSTHPASSEGALRVQTDDELFANFGISELSQPTAKVAQRRTRFSIGITSDEEESPKVQEPVPGTIPPSLFFGKEKPKPKKSAISSPQLLKIDPFSLRPKPIPTSPKPHLKRKSLGPAAQPSPKSKSPALRFAPSPNDSLSSEMELTEAISGNIFLSTPSPSSVATEATPQSVSTPRSMELASAGTPDWRNKTTLDDDMDFTRVMPTKIFDRTETQSSVPGDGSLHCTFRNSVMMEFPRPVTGVAIRNEQHLVTGVNQSVSCTSNSIVMGLSRSVTKSNQVESHPATVSRPEDMEVAKMISSNAGSCLESGTQPANVADVVADDVPVARLNSTVRVLEGMEFTKVVSSPVVENRNCTDARNVTVYEPDVMEFTRVVPGLPLEGNSEHVRGPPPNQTLNDSAGMDLTEAIPILQETHSVPTACNATLNKTLNDSAGMDLTEVIPYVPQLHSPGIGKSFGAAQLSKKLNDSVGMEFMKVIPSAPQLQTPGFSKSFRAEPFNKTLNDSVGMEFTKVVPSAPQLQTPELSKSFRAEPFNKTVNDSVGMEFTKVIPSAPQLQTPGLSKAAPLTKTLNDTVEMDFTKAVPTAPQLPTLGSSKSFRAEPLNKTLNSTVGMDFTKTVPTASQLLTPGLSKSLRAEPLNKTLNDTVGMDFTKVVQIAPQLPTPGLSKSLRAEPLNKTLNGTVGMDFTKTVPTASQLLTPGLSKSLRAEPLNKTLNDTVGMDFTKVVQIAPQLPTPGLSKSLRAEPLNKTLNDTVGMDFTEAVPTAPQLPTPGLSKSLRAETLNSDNIPGGASENQILASDVKNTFLESVNFTETGASPVLPASSKADECSQHPFSDLGSSIKPVEIENSPSAYARAVSIATETTTSVSVNDTSIQRGENNIVTSLTNISITSGIRTPSVRPTATQPSDIEASLSRAEGICCNLPSLTQETLPPSYVECSLSRTVNLPSCQTSVQETVPTPLREGDLENIRGDIRSTAASSQEKTPQVSLTSHPLPTSKVCRKRSIEEVDGTEPNEVASQVSRSSISSARIVPSEIVIPSSRSPSPVELDSSTRFPGLSQSFSMDRSLNSEAAPSLNPSVMEQEYHHTVLAKAEEAFRCVNNEISSVGSPSNPVEAVSSPTNLPAPVERPMEEESDDTLSSARSEVARKFNSRDECDVTDVSPKTMSMGVSFGADSLFHKSIMDVSVPSMLLESIDLGVEEDVSRNATLYATLCEAENNVSLFHKEREGNVSSIEKSTNVCRGDAEVLPCNDLEEKNMSVGEEVDKEDISEEHGRCRRDTCEELGKKRVEERGAIREELEKSASQPREDKAVESVVPGSPTNSVLPRESPCLIEPDRRSLFDWSSTKNMEASLTVAASRTAEEIIRTHRLQYRKRGRCNWTWQKLSSGEWSFFYLDDSVELRIKVEESSRSQLLSGHGGRFISLLDDSLDGLWHIGGRLLYQKLSEKWASRLQKTADVLSLVEDVNRMANEVEKLKTTLAYLHITKNIYITNDWICFDVQSRKTSDIWFKVKVDCRDVMNLRQSHVSIENIIGETRETDIQNLVTCVKKGPFILKNYVAVVEEYLETIERIQ